MLVTGAVKLPVYNGISCSICIYVVANTKWSVANGNACSMHKIQSSRNSRGKLVECREPVWAWGNTLPGETYITVTCDSVGC